MEPAAPAQVNILFSILPLVFFTIVSAVTSHVLAREKGRKVWLWTLLGAIPILNFLFMYYFLGAANLRLERKIDEIAQLLNKSGDGHSIN